MSAYEDEDACYACQGREGSPSGDSSTEHQACVVDVGGDGDGDKPMWVSGSPEREKEEAGQRVCV